MQANRVDVGGKLLLADQNRVPFFQVSLDDQ